jgi:hypothetical protein
MGFGASAAQDNGKGLPVIVEEMTSLLEEARQQPWCYDWLPLSGVVTLVALVAAAVLRPSGRFAVALSHMQPALDFLEIDLSSRGIAPQVRLVVPLMFLHQHTSLHYYLLFFFSLLGMATAWNVFAILPAI